MIPRPLVVVFAAALAAACSASAPLPPQASAPAALATPPALEREPCDAEGIRASVKEDMDDVYDEFLHKSGDAIYDDDDDPYRAGDPKAAARREALKGLSAYKEQRWDAAREAFYAAWGFLRHPYNAHVLADLEMKRGHYADAMYYCDFVQRSKQADAKQRDDAAAWAREAGAKVAHLRVTATPDGACVVVGGLNVGSAPLKEAVPVNAGVVRVSARYHGAVDRKEISLGEGATGEAALKVK